jgi:hypothetical protein
MGYFKSEGFGFSMNCEGRKSILFKTFPFNGHIPVQENPFLAKSIRCIFINVSFTRPATSCPLIQDWIPSHP